MVNYWGGEKNIEEFDSLPSKQCSLLDFKYMWLIEVREEELKIFLEITRNCCLLSQELLEHKHAQGQLTASWLVPLKPKKQDAQEPVSLGPLERNRREAAGGQRNVAGQLRLPLGERLKHIEPCKGTGNLRRSMSRCLINRKPASLPTLREQPSHSLSPGHSWLCRGI